MIGYVLILCMALGVATSHILLKKYFYLLRFDEGFYNLIWSLYNTPFIIAVLLILIDPVLYILALSDLDLNVAFSFAGLQYVFVVIGSSFFLDERISKRRWTGVMSIVIGIILFSYNGGGLWFY